MTSVITDIKNITSNKEAKKRCISLFSSASIRFDKLVDKGLAQKRGNQLLPSNERFSHSISINQ